MFFKPQFYICSSKYLEIKINRADINSVPKLTIKLNVSKKCYVIVHKNVKNAPLFKFQKIRLTSNDFSVKEFSSNIIEKTNNYRQKDTDNLIFIKCHKLGLPHTAKLVNDQTFHLPC